MIHRDPLKSRSITLTDKARPHVPHVNAAEDADGGLVQDLQSIGTGNYGNTITLPLVGQVAAGIPILAEENIEDNITLPVERRHRRGHHRRRGHGEALLPRARPHPPAA